MDGENGTSSLASTSKTRSRRASGRRYACEFPNCNRSYSRAEHLHRHELNHNSKETLFCDVPGCRRRFVRRDLLERHKERHKDGAPFSSNKADLLDDDSVLSRHNERAKLPDPSTTATMEYSPNFVHPQRFDCTGNDARLFGQVAVASTDATTMPGAPLLATVLDHTPRQASLSYLAPDMRGGHISNSIDDIGELNPFGLMDLGTFQSNIDDRQPFATWLFDTEGSVMDLDLANLPFLDFGLESTFQNLNEASDHGGSQTSRFYSPDMIVADTFEPDPHERVSEARRQAVVQLVHTCKQKRRKPLFPKLAVFLSIAPDGDMPLLSVEFLHDCISAFWHHISPQMPFIHRPTFCPNTCPLLLFGVMIILGSSTLNRLNPKGVLDEYAAFADLLAETIRWEIFTHPAASPPAELWVQQALLLLELYEKMFSSIELHERAHIHHASTLNLLRRGNPLIGRSGSESPIPERTSRLNESGIFNSSGPSWWLKWAQAEAQNRVVFAAYLLDCSHSILFGHAAVLSPHEIRLPLPCDELSWTAPTAEALHRADQGLKMYGVKNVNFLDGLKRALHGHKVRTHPWARRIIMYGLISVACHINQRESTLMCFDTPNTAVEQDRCRKLLLSAFDTWKKSFDEALSDPEPLIGLRKKRTPQRSCDDPNNPHAVYFLAHLSLQANVVDFQILAGSERVAGRKVSNRDKGHAVGRVQEWSKTEGARHAVRHAFQFLHAMLLMPQKQHNSSPNKEWVMPSSIYYSCRQDELNYRPWVLYLATLTIWAFTFALNPSARYPITASTGLSSQSSSNVISGYLLMHATASTSADFQHLKLDRGLIELLDMLHAGFEDTESDILLEARIRLKACRDMLCVS